MAISKYKPPRGAYIWRGDLTEGILRYEFGGLIFGGAYTWRGLFRNFTVTFWYFQLTNNVLKLIWFHAITRRAAEVIDWHPVSIFL